MRIVISIFIALFIIGCNEKAPQYKKHKEKYYQTKFCKKIGGEMEVVLSDRTRVDCLTNEYAIEVDFAKKWAEGIGQGLYYGYMTDKKPAVALICGSRDKRYLKRLQRVANRYNIKVFVIEK